DPDVWAGIVLASSWYPVRAWNRAFRAAVESQPDRQAELRRLAHFVSERDLSTVFRMILNIAQPESVLSRASHLWARYFDGGTVTATKRADRFWQVRLDAPADAELAPDELTCFGLCGWLERALAMTGVKTGRVVQPRCRYINTGGP